jgi:hypothetical protein
MLACMKVSAAKWAEMVAAWEGSGQTAMAFAAERGVAESSLRWWKTELARRAAKDAARRSTDVRRRSHKVAVARVVVRKGEVGMPIRTAPFVSIDIGGARIVVEAGFDRELLREVVQALGVPR